MFEAFCREFSVEIVSIPTYDQETSWTEFFRGSKPAISFMKVFSGHTFKGGLYRVHYLKDVQKWNQIVTAAFPEFDGYIQCFAYDWLGRQFALDYRKLSIADPTILMFEPGTGEALEIPVPFLAFHEEELIEYQDAALAVEFYHLWIQTKRDTLKHHQCVGYRVPLFLGGEDDLSNLEIQDLEVYWSIAGQMKKKITHLPEGTHIDQLKISE